MSEPLLAHNVYFALTDNSQAAQARLITDCKKYLSKHAGIVFFAVGSLAKDLCRPVNDRDFDVGLHIAFQTQANHDAYQVHPLHEQFVADNKSNWKKVRVFDSAVEQEIGRALAAGEFGENLTTEGIDPNKALVGERWQIGTTVLEVSESRIPCWRLGVRMNDKMFPRRFTEALRPGTYLRIVVEGDVGAGDEIRVVERPDHDLTIRDVFRIYTSDRDEADRLLAVPRMSESWKRWAHDLLQKTKDRPSEAAGPGCC